jgi:hypothetical protein
LQSHPRGKVENQYKEIPKKKTPPQKPQKKATVRQAERKNHAHSKAKRGKKNKVVSKIKKELQKKSVANPGISKKKRRKDPLDDGSVVPK